MSDVRDRYKLHLEAQKDREESHQVSTEEAQGLESLKVYHWESTESEDTGKIFVNSNYLSDSGQGCLSTPLIPALRG